MLFSSRRDGDADVIRARLRALLAEGAGRGWLPDDAVRTPAQDGADAADVSARTPRPDVDTADWDDDGDTDDWSVDPADAATDVGTAPLPAPGRRPSDPPGTAGRHRASGPATRVGPGPRGARTLWVVAVVTALLVAGWSWLGRPAVEPVTNSAPAAGALETPGTGASTTTAGPVPGTPVPIVVDVVGLVRTPGLVTLPAGSRVADALAAAGGLLPEADPTTINAAALLSDGQQVAVGVPGAGAAGPVSSGGASGSGPVNLNTAMVADLDALPGIGPVLAQRILDHREQQGPFQTVQQLDDVSGIGPALYADIAPLVTV